MPSSRRTEAPVKPNVGSANPSMTAAATTVSAMPTHGLRSIRATGRAAWSTRRRTGVEPAERAVVVLRMVSSSNSAGNATSSRNARAMPPVTATVVGVIGKLPKIGRVEAKVLGESRPSCAAIRCDAEPPAPSVAVVTGHRWGHGGRSHRGVRGDGGRVVAGGRDRDRELVIARLDIERDLGLQLEGAVVADSRAAQRIGRRVQFGRDRAVDRQPRTPQHDRLAGRQVGAVERIALGCR